MIVRKIGRKSTQRSAANERQYTRTLSRYIMRAAAEDVRALEQLSDDDYVRDLASYVARHGQAEQVRGAGAMNLFGQNLEEWTAELEALRFRATSGMNVADHWVLSWYEHDAPSDDQILESVRIFLECQGLEKCPVLWGIHGDTDNVHVHLMITRLDAISGRRVEAGQGWAIDCGHRAKAVIEDRFPQFRREEGSAYRVVDGRLIDVRSQSDIGSAHDPSQWRRVRSRRNEGAHDEPGIYADIEKRLDEPSRTYERETGFKSHARVALEEAVPLLLGSKSWQEAHRQLAKIGMEIEVRRKGGLLRLGDKTVKLSIDRNTSYRRLVERYGAFREADVSPAPYEPRELHALGSQEATYFADKRAFLARLNNVAASLRAVEASRGVSASLSEMSRKDLFLSATFPSFAAWERGEKPLDPADFLMAVTGGQSVVVGPLSNGRPKPYDIPGLIGFRRRNLVIYRKIDDLTAPPAITDAGSLLVIHDFNNAQTVRAALSIAAKKWPGEELFIEGHPEFLSIALPIARELGLKVGAVDRRGAVEIAALTRQATEEPPMAIEAPVESTAPAPVPRSPEIVSDVAEHVAKELDDFDRWKELTRKRQDKLERERLAFVIAQSEELMAQARREGFADRIAEQAQARREWLARLGASQGRGRG